jgi:hypothetical protein
MSPEESELRRLLDDVLLACQIDLQKDLTDFSEAKPKDVQGILHRQAKLSGAKIVASAIHKAINKFDKEKGRE